MASTLSNILIGASNSSCCLILGESLGAAFEDFNVQDLFPALSLNVRQSVRLNFGQHKFLHSPDQIDGKPFTAIIRALDGGKASPSAPSAPAATLSSKDTSGTSRKSALVTESTTESERLISRAAAPSDIVQSIATAAAQASEVVNTALPPNVAAQSTGTESSATSNPPNLRNDSDRVGNLLESLDEELRNYELRSRQHRQVSDTAGLPAGQESGDQEEDDLNAAAYTMDNRWHDLEARMRMEAEEDQDEDFGMGEGRSDDDEEEDEEEDDEEDEEEEDAELDQERRQLRMANRSEEEDGEDQHGERGGGEEDGGNDGDGEAAHASSHMVELRRQAMVESLLGMGFPVDWALRAAEHCDSNSSESAAISWIIERMEMEQANLNDLDQDSSSRAADGEEYDELDNGDIGYFIQRHAPGGHSLLSSNPSASTASASNNRSISTETDRNRAISRRLVAEHMAELLESANMGLSANVSATMSPGSPTREEAYGFRRSINNAALGMILRGEDGNSGYSSLLANKIANKKALSKGNESGVNADLFGAGNKDLDGFDLAFSDAAVWNNETTFSPLLPGIYTTRRRHDSDKQEVLAQIVELEAMDMITIVATCEFALCIYYARAIFLRILQCARYSHHNQVLSATLADQSLLSPSPLPAMMTAFSTELVTSLLRNIFKQHILVLPQCDRLFPLLAHGNIAGDVSHKLPAMPPFTPTNRLLFYDVLRILEGHYYRNSMTSLAMEDSSLQGLQEIAFLVHSLTDSACQIGSSANAHLSSNSGSEEKRDDSNSSISSSLMGLQERLLSKVGFSTPPQPGGEEQLSHLNNDMLGELVEYCINSMERALSSRYEGHDWISGSLQRANANFELLKGQLSSPDALDSSSSPYILFSYYILRLVLSRTMEFSKKKCLLSTVTPPDPSTSTSSTHLLSLPSSPVIFMLLGLEDRFFSKFSALYSLISPETLSKLLKLSSSLNDSLRFCAYDLCALVLSVINLHLLRLSFAVLNSHLIQLGSTHFNSPSLGAASETMHRDNQMDLRLNLSDPSKFQSSFPQLIAAEYYISVAKEKRLLYLLGTRFKVESLEKALYTRYTRSIAALLFQWNLLRRQINLSASTQQYLRSFRLQTIFSPQLALKTTKDIGSTRHEQFLRVVQVTCTSITIQWQLTHLDPKTNALSQDTTCPQDDDLDELDGYNLYLTSQSQMHMENTTLVMSNIDLSNTFRIDGLDPDILYEISIHRDQYSSSPSCHFIDQQTARSPPLVMMVNTDMESTFGFNTDAVCPNISISSSNPLTLRNRAVKKWSTARANMKMTSGLHRWDVHIDRCVSKNIFVGVATKDARLDNYVGCDAHGWAFLANRAIWHNKAKIKSYGDLFRSGDTVTVILDLDIGTLSFCLNDRPFGVAVEGLVGPLYPAFSLYNEDDQITIAQVRSVQDGPTNYGSFCAENVLDRMESARGLLQYFSACHHCYSLLPSQGISRDDNSEGKPGPMKELTLEERKMIQPLFLEEVCEEVIGRYQVWQENIVLRSFCHRGQIITLQVGSLPCLEFSRQALHWNMAVRYEDKRCRVIGVGGGKLWLHVENDGELIGLTFDSLQLALEKKLLLAVTSSEVVDYSSRTCSPKNKVHGIFASHAYDMSLRHLLIPLYDSKLLFEKLSSMFFQWSYEEDVLLMECVDRLAGYLHTDPLSLSCDAVLHLFMNEQLRFEHNMDVPQVERLMSRHPIGDIILRFHLLNVMNDLLIPLLPLITPFTSCDDSSCHVNHPSRLMVELRDILYPMVCHSFSLALCVTLC